jgi:hypothetical protein
MTILMENSSITNRSHRKGAKIAKKIIHVKNNYKNLCGLCAFAVD